jgi:hypothetical integral membrane protein (TIGR02206 family)
MFDMLHLITLLVLIIIFLFIRWKKDFFVKPKNDLIFRFTLGFTLLVFESGFHIWVFVTGGYSYHMIPLTGFCAMTNVLTIYALLFNKIKLFDYLIYYALTGSLFALVFVDTTYGIPHFRYFHYFIVHYGFLLTSLYYFITDRIQVNRKNYLTASSILLGYTLIVLVVDLFLEENWFYLFESPVKEISDFFGQPLYTILWIVFIILLTGFWYLLLKAIRKHHKK